MDDNKKHLKIYYEGTVGFYCGDTLIRTILGDGNVSFGECPVCGIGFETTGSREDGKSSVWF